MHTNANFTNFYGWNFAGFFLYFNSICTMIDCMVGVIYIYT